MKKIIILFLTLYCIPGFSQIPAMEDVIYLKTGSVLRGKIIEQKTGVLKIELLGGSVFVFEPNEIDSIKRENTLKRTLNSIKKNYLRRDKGFRNMTELGIIYGVDTKKNNSPSYYYSTPADDFGISLHTVNGYQFWPYLYAGAGVGIERLITYKQTFSPFYLRLSSEFLKRRVTPYVSFDVGYSHLWKQKNDDNYSYQNKGGLYLQCGGGVRIYTASRASVMLGLAYKRNSSETKWWYTQTTDGSYYTIKRTYQRLVVNLGVSF